MAERRSRKQLQVATRRRNAMERYAAGWSYTRIYQEAGLGYPTIAHVRTDIARGMKDTARPYDEYRDLQDVRLNKLWESFWPDGRRRDTKAAEVLLKLHDRISYLHGLNYGTRPVDNAEQERSMLTELQRGIAERFAELDGTSDTGATDDTDIADDSN